MSEGTASKLMFVIVQLGLVLAMFASLALDDIQLGVLFLICFLLLNIEERLKHPETQEEQE